MFNLFVDLIYVYYFLRLLIIYKEKYEVGKVMILVLVYVVNCLIKLIGWIFFINWFRKNKFCSV